MNKMRKRILEVSKSAEARFQLLQATESVGRCPCGDLIEPAVKYCDACGRKNVCFTWEHYEARFGDFVRAVNCAAVAYDDCSSGHGDVRKHMADPDVQELLSVTINFCNECGRDLRLPEPVPESPKFSMTFCGCGEEISFLDRNCRVCGKPNRVYSLEQVANLLWAPVDKLRSLEQHNMKDCGRGHAGTFKLKERKAAEARSRGEIPKRWRYCQFCGEMLMPASGLAYMTRLRDARRHTCTCGEVQNAMPRFCEICGTANPIHDLESAPALYLNEAEFKRELEKMVNDCKAGHVARVAWLNNPKDKADQRCVHCTWCGARVVTVVAT